MSATQQADTSIATRILAAMLGVYLGVATVVTGIHTWSEYRYQRANILQGLGDIEDAFEGGLAMSLWGLDEGALRASVQGMLKIPTLDGVKIEAADGKIVAIGGIVARDGATGKVPLHVSLSGCPKDEITVRKHRPYEIFQREFQIVYDPGNENMRMGRATVYSTSSVIYQRMKWQIAMLVVNVLVTVITFSLALTWTVNRYLRTPLASFTAAVENVSLESLASINVDLRTSARDELRILEQAFNTMIADLSDSVEERRRAEEAISIFKSAVENSTDAVGMATGDGSHYYQNEAFDKLFGPTIGNDPPASVYADESAGRNVFETIMAGKQWIGEVQMIAADKSIRDIYLRAYPLLGGQGQVVNLIGVHTDITESRRAERELRQLRNYLANIINSMPSVLIGLDTDGNVTQWNRQAERLTGVQASDAVGRPLALAIPRLAEEIDRVSEAIKTRQEQPGIRRTCLHDGETRYEDVTVYPLISNGIEGAVLRVDDVTERVRIEEMMIQSEKMMSIGGLAAGMAHEINNPLAGMMQTATVLSSRLTGDLPANHAAAEEAGTSMEAIRAFMERRGIPRMLQRINDAGKRAAGIVSNMLSFARKGDSAASPTDLAALLDQSLDLAGSDYDLKKNYDFRQIRVVREYEDDLPKILCESSKIQQVLLNILRNGAEAMFDPSAPDGDPCFNLRLSLDRQDNMIRLEIQDNGPGMDEATRRRVFEPFFTTKPPNRGTGLGLSVSYFIIADNHSGDMAVESAVGKGTKFTIRLPVINTDP